MTRRTIIDTNALQSPQLRAYLSRSPSHFAVLTDYSAMESYKGNTLVNIFRNMEVLADFPKQVIILKSTATVCGLRGRRAGLQRRMIDDDQTRNFQNYCDALQLAKRGHVSAQRQLLEHGREADAHLTRLLDDAVKLPEILETVAATFSEDELKIIRTKVPFTHSLMDKVLKFVIDLTASFFSTHPNVTVIPGTNELTNTFLFRVALCSVVWALDWIGVGGAKGVKPEKIRNDIVDVNFATFATFFDGLLSMDNKVVRLYQHALAILELMSGGKLVNGSTISPT